MSIVLQRPAGTPEAGVDLNLVSLGDPLDGGSRRNLSLLGRQQQLAQSRLSRRPSFMARTQALSSASQQAGMQPSPSSRSDDEVDIESFIDMLQEE